MFRYNPEKIPYRVRDDKATFEPTPYRWERPDLAVMIAISVATDQ